MDNIETLLASLKSISVEWRNRNHTTQYHADYLHHLQKMKGHIVSLRETSQKHEEAISKELVVQLVSVAIEHAMTGTLPCIVVLTWLDFLDTILKIAQDDIRISNVVPGLWNTIMGHSKGNSGASATALCAELRILQLLLKYVPVEMKGALRKHLPHPVKNHSVAARVCGLECMPWIVANLPSSALTQEFLKYIQRGLTSGVWPVQEASIEAVRTIMELGIDIDAATGHQLMELLAATCNDAPFASLKSQEDVGIALGYLLLLSQCGFKHRSVTPAVSWDEELSWSWLGGSTPDEAHRVARCLFHSHMSRVMQQVLAIAISVLFRVGCSDSTLSEALRSAFVLLVPVPGDSRTYMPRLLANALRDWALQLPTHASRLTLVNSIRKYVRSIGEDKSVVCTAVIALDMIVPTLASPRELNVSFEQDLLLALKTHPSLLEHVSNILGVMGAQIRDSFYQHRLLHSFVRSSQCISNAEGGELSRDFVLWTKAVLVSLREGKTDGEASVAMIGPIITVVLQLSNDELESGYGENDKFRRAELFFMLIKSLLECYCHYVSHFVKTQLELAVKRLMFFLVNTPSKLSVYCRAACAACSLLTSSSFCDTPTDTQRMLCIGLLEGQLMETSRLLHELDSSTKAESSLFQRDMHRLKGEVYNVIAKGPWKPCPDEGSLRWLVTQALNDLEKACKDGVPVCLEDKELFPLAAASYLRSSRCILPTAVDMTYAKSLEQAVRLVGWGFHHFVSANTSEGRDFCEEILKRLRAIAATQAHINLLDTGVITPSKSGNPTKHGTVDADTITKWNLLVCWIMLFDSTMGKGVDSSLPDLFRTTWTTNFLSSLQELEKITSSCIDSTLFDLKVLACRVLGFTWCLLDQTDILTTKMGQEGPPSTDKVLAIVEAHAYCSLTDQPSATLPMTILLASELPKRYSLPNDPCSLSELTILTAFIRLAEAYPSESAQRLPVALGNCFLASMPPSIDPLVLSLSLVFFSLLSPLADTFVQDGLPDLIAACMGHAVAWKRPPYQMDEIEDGANVSLVGHMLHYYQTPALPLNSNKINMYIAVSERLWELLCNSNPYNNGDIKIATSFQSLVRRVVVLRHLPDCFLRRAAQLWTQCHAEIFTEGFRIPMKLLEVARLVDFASTKETRKAWLKLGQIIIQHHVDTMHTQKSSKCLQLIQDIRELLLARSASFSAATSHSTRETFSTKSHSHGVKISGSDDYEGEQSFLGEDTVKGGRMRRSSKKSNHETTTVQRNSGVVSCDLPAKEFALRMLIYLFPLLPTSAAEMHHAYLNLVTISGSLVEAFPDLLGSVTDLLIDVLTHYNDSYEDDPEDSLSFITERKIPLLSCAKTLIRLSVFRVARGCELARVFLHNKLADDCSMLRIVQSLTLLLTTLDSLNNGDRIPEKKQSHTDELAEEGGRLIIRSRASGLVATELARIADYAESRGWTETSCAAVQSLHSPAGQSALFSLCAHFVSLISMFNGYQAPPTLIYSGPPDVDLELVNVDAALAAVAYIAQKGVEGEQGLGPGLRYAVGCLCCILMAIEGTHLHILPSLAGSLLILHQEILVQMAYCALISDGSESVPESDVPLLLCILAQTTGVAKTNAMAVNLLSYCERRYAATTQPIPVTVTESLLHIFFTIQDNQSAALASISKLLWLCPLDYLFLSPSMGLIRAASEFCRSITVGHTFGYQQREVLEKLALSGTSGLILSELVFEYHRRQTLLGTPHISSWRSALEAQEPSQCIAQLLVQAYAETDDPLALTVCLISPVSTLVKATNIISAIVSSESVDIFVKCHSSMCYIFEFLLFHMTPSDGLSVQERITIVIQVLTTLLTSGPHQHMIPSAFRSVGASLVQRVAKNSPSEFRAAIQPLEREKVMILRNFMETSVL